MATLQEQSPRSVQARMFNLTSNKNNYRSYQESIAHPTLSEANILTLFFRAPPLITIDVYKGALLLLVVFD